MGRRNAWSGQAGAAGDEQGRRAEGELPDQPYVLVVEDDPALRAFLLEVLREEGVPAAGAEDGLPALHLAVRRCPLVILLDLGTPNMDGESFMRLYRALPGPHAPVVLMTGHQQAELLVRELEADGLLPKPFDLDELAALVQRFSCSTMAA